MPAAGTIFYPLPSAASRALDAAIDWTHDLWQEDLARLGDLLDEVEADTNPDLSMLYLTGDLPPDVRAALSAEMVRKLYICLTMAGWKLYQPFPLRPACVAEELCLHAIIQEAKTLLEDGSDVVDATPDERRVAALELEELYDFAFDDTDFLDMFDPAMDGIDTSQVGQMMGLTSLTVDDLFRPFLGEDRRGTVHPYVAKQRSHWPPAPPPEERS